MSKEALEMFSYLNMRAFASIEQFATGSRGSEFTLGYLDTSPMEWVNRIINKRAPARSIQAADLRQAPTRHFGCKRSARVNEMILLNLFQCPSPLPG
jgi:hypothetical protein